MECGPVETYSPLLFGSNLSNIMGLTWQNLAWCTFSENRENLTLSAETNEKFISFQLFVMISGRRRRCTLSLLSLLQLSFPSSFRVALLLSAAR